MERTFLIILLLLVILSCKDLSLNGINKSQVISVIKEETLRSGLNDSTVMEIDSVYILKIDLHTPKHDSFYVNNMILNRLYYDSTSIYYWDSNHLKKEITFWEKQNKKDLKDLLTPCYICEEGPKKQLSNIMIANEYRKEFIPRLERLKELFAQNKIDSTPKGGYVVKYSLKGADFSNREVVLDSAWIFLTENYRIMNMNKIYNADIYSYSFEY